MKKFFLAAAVALMGFSGASAATPTLQDGHCYKLHNVTLPQFYLGLDGTKASLVAEDDAITFYFSANPDNSDQFLIRRNDEEGDIIGTSTWFVAVDNNDSHFWTVDYVTDTESEYPVINLHQDFATWGNKTHSGLMGADYGKDKDGQPNTDRLLYCDKGEGFANNWYAIDVTPATEPGEVVMSPAVTSLTNGGTYYIYDSFDGVGTENGDRVGFFGDRGANVDVSGPHETAEEAYNATNLGDNTVLVTGTNHAHNVVSLTGAQYVWRAEQDEAGMWAFKNVGTGRYIGAGNTPATEPEWCIMEVFPGGNGPDYFKVTGATNGKQMDCNSEKGYSTLSWWAGSGHPMQFYQAVADGENATGETTYKFAAEDPNARYTVTVNFVCGEDIVGTASKSGKPGVLYSFNAPAFYTTEDGQPYAGEIGSKDETINVPVTESLPFHASATVEGAQYQAVMIQSSYYTTPNPFTFAYDPDEDELSAPRTNTTAAEPYSDNQMFAFIGSLKDGFKIYSKAAEQYLVYGDKATLDDEGTLFELRVSSSNADAQFFTLFNADANQYLNFNAGNETISHWGQADNGSTMWVAGVSQPVINYYTDFFNQAAELAGDDPEVTASIQYAQGYLATLNPYDELTEDDLAEVAEIKDMLEMMVQAVAKKNALKVYYDASYLGAAAYEADTELLYVATSVEDLETAYQTLLGDAKEYFINSFVQGAYLKNKRADKYMGYVHTEEEDPNDDEHIIVTTEYAKFVTPTLDCYFTAEVTTEGIKLYNPASKTYLGIQPENATVPAVTAATEIALYEVVAGNNGFEFRCINAPDPNDDEVMVENNYINTDSYSGPLVVWNYANDGGAFWIAEDLPMFDEYNSVELAGEGIAIDGKNTNLTKVSVVTTDEAQPTMFAVVTVTDAEGKVVATATIAEANGTGVYDITLAEPITAAGVYTISIAKGAFVLDLDGEVMYSPAVTTKFAIEGDQDSISEITLGERRDAIYDLQGRKVATPARGLYIINGVKVVK